jgi:hypothetical protein
MLTREVPYRRRYHYKTGQLFVAMALKVVKTTLYGTPGVIVLRISSYERN